MCPSKAGTFPRSWLPAERLDTAHSRNGDTMRHSRLHLKDDLMSITLQQWLSRQPYTQSTDSDRYYTQLANRIYALVKTSPLKHRLNDDYAKSLCCDIVGYFADILSETGLWAAFLSHHRTLYGRTLPFFPAENYYDGEVNRDDVRVLLWYLLGTHDTLHEILSPLDSALLETADQIYDLLESEYETAPDSPLLQEFCLPEQNEIDDPDARYRFAEWLFWDSFLLGPSNRSLARQLLHEVHDKAYPEKEKLRQLEKLRRKSLYELPAGPLALFAHEWVSLLWQHSFPEEPEETKELHPYYLQFTQSTGGSPIKYIASYTELDRFLSNEMQWGEAKGGHLSHLSRKKNFVLYVTPYKGMLIASEVAQCISDPANPCYDKEKARREAISLLTYPGRCPIDLLLYLCSHDLLPDACFADGDHRLVADNWDFIARCLLQDYYRAV